MENKIRCPCCGREPTIQVYFSGNHSTYTLLDEVMYKLVCTDCGYSSKRKSNFYSKQELINHFE